MTIEQLVAGTDTVKQILHKSEDFENRTLNEYLQGMAHNLSLNK